VLRQPANAEVLERSVFINSLLYRKGISWTRLMADLEKTMPPNVRVLNIRPYLTGRNQITLELMVGSESGEAVLPLYKSLESSPVFGSVLPLNYQPPTQAEPLHRYRFTVNYAQKL
jgi:Tfp pilus assembly protein PilN